MAYCSATDLLLGNIPTPTYLDKDKYVDLAADEIDAALGFRYVTPIVVTNPVAGRASELLLKHINIHIASGRLILAAAAGGSDDDVHAYGMSLLRQGREALARLAAGDPPLTGATVLSGGPSVTSGAPIVSNGDPYSLVDEFYRIVNPSNGAPISGDGHY